MTDIGPCSRLIVCHPHEAFEHQDKIDRQWRDLNFTAAPDFARACRQFDAFFELLQSHGPAIHRLGHNEPGAEAFSARQLTLDALYVRDASIMSARGAILCHMGKPARFAEPDAQAAAYAALGVPVIGRIEPPGRLEGGDFTWLGPRLAAVGRGYRTNDEGIRQLRCLLGDSIDDLIEVALPHYRGAGDVFHLMSIISPVDRDLAVVFSPLMSVCFRERLLDLGYTLVEVPEEEFDSMAANVLALTPRRCIMVDGNPKTRAALESAGADVQVYDGSEISLKGGGGPTCLTRPV